MAHEITRRAVFGTAGLAGVALMVPSIAVATASPASSEIERQWHDRCVAYREFEGDPDVLEDNERANEYWDRIDATEIAILNSADSGTRATELRLWVAWSHCDETNRPAVAQGDVPALLSIRHRLDWHEKLIFAAILNLRGEVL